jgi:hypothetical protein
MEVTSLQMRKEKKEVLVDITIIPQGIPKLLRSVRRAKQAKFYADWAGRTATWQGRTVLT